MDRVAHHIKNFRLTHNLLLLASITNLSANVKDSVITVSVAIFKKFKTQQVDLISLLLSLEASTLASELKSSKTEVWQKIVCT